MQQTFNWIREQLYLTSCGYGNEVAIDTDSALGIIDEAEARWKATNTAYDVEAVIKQIQNYMGCNSKCREEFANGRGCSACSWSRIFEIVRKGGVE